MFFKKCKTPYLRITWSNGDVEIVKLSEEFIKQWKENKQQSGPYKGWTISSESGSWNMQHARSVSIFI